MHLKRHALMQRPSLSAFTRGLCASSSPALPGLDPDRFTLRFGSQEAAPATPAPPQVDMEKVDRKIQQALRLMNRAKTPEQKIGVAQATWHSLPMLRSLPVSQPEQGDLLDEIGHQMNNIGMTFNAQLVWPVKNAKAPFSADFDNRFAACMPFYRQVLEDCNLFLREGLQNKPLRYIWGRIKPTMQALAAEKGIQFTVSGEDLVALFESPLRRSNGANLHTVLLNLVQNAIKYTPPQGQVNVSFSTDRRRNKEKTHDVPFLKIAVEDTGLGFPQSEVKAAFAGKRGATAIQSGIPGTGFGLQRIFKVLYKARGTYCVESPLNPDAAYPGTRITCRIPTARSTWTALPVEEKLG